MKFDWSEISEEDWTDYCARMENGMITTEDFLGCVRIGELAFDVVATPETLAIDCYVGDVDSGYGYSKIDDGYPYDEVGGIGFDDTCIAMTYAEFRALAERRMEDFLDEDQIFYHYADLREKASMPLHVW